MPSIKSSATSKLQSQLITVKNEVEETLSKKNLRFTSGPVEIENETEDEKIIGYSIKTSQISASIVPNFRNRKVEFLLLNEKMIEHLMQEGFSDEEIMANGRVWFHLKKKSDFLKLVSN
jgi:hypothetical protein